MSSLCLENSIMGAVSFLCSIFFSSDMSCSIFVELAGYDPDGLAVFPIPSFSSPKFLIPGDILLLNSCYWVFQNKTVTSHSLRLQTAKLCRCKLHRVKATAAFLQYLGPCALHIRWAWQKRRILHNALADGMDYYPLKLYKLHCMSKRLSGHWLSNGFAVKTALNIWWIW